METITCKVCGSHNESNKYMCKKCGKFLFESEFIPEKTEIKMGRIISNLKENPHTDIFWNETIDAYTRKVERIQSLLQIQDNGIESAELTAKIEQFLQMCRKPEFEIAFVGAVKAGKSTLINALLGRNYASTDPNPETAVLTKFRSSEQDYVKVKFYSTKEWEKLWRSVQTDAERFIELYYELHAERHKEKWIGHSDLYIELDNSEIEEELKKWSSSSSEVHFFVKEIEVGISSLPKEFPKQVIFVDTPGLFDPVVFRSQISIDYIHKANAVLVCVKAEDLHGEEVKTLESVFSFSGHKKNKVFVIATNWDKLNNIIVDWAKRRQYMVNTFTGKAFFPTKEMALNNIMYAASYHFNLCREYASLKTSEKNAINLFLMKMKNSIEECMEKKVKVPQTVQEIMDIQMGLLSSDDLRKIMMLTNIHKINEVIAQELINQYEEVLYGDIINLYGEIRHLVKRVVGEKKKSIDERITISNADMGEIENKIDELKTNREEIQKLQQQLVAALKSLRQSTQKRCDAITSQLK